MEAGQPPHNSGERGLDGRRGGRGSEQEPEQQAQHGLPDPQAHVPPGHVDDAAEDRHQRDGHHHGCLTGPSRLASSSIKAQGGLRDHGERQHGPTNQDPKRRGRG